MDALSRTLALYPARSALDVRCQLGAPWVLRHEAEAPGVAPYHLIVSGTAWLERSGADSIELRAGDTPPLRINVGARGLQWKRNDGDGAVADILCGKFEFEHGAANPVLMALP